MQVEHLADDFPLPLDLYEIEEVRKSVSRPVVGVQTHVGCRPDHIDAGETALDARRRAVLVVSIVETLDRAAEKVGADVAEDRGVAMEGGLHRRTLAGARTVDVALDYFGDLVDFVDVAARRGHV